MSQIDFPDLLAFFQTLRGKGAEDPIIGGLATLGLFNVSFGCTSSSAGPDCL